MSEALSSVQDNMTAYLNSKTSDSLEEYYRSDQIFDSMVQEMNSNVTDRTSDRMERNIKSMSAN